MFNKVVSVACALMASTLASQDENNPFVGEHHDADYVKFDTHTSHRAEKVNLGFHKYDNLLDKTSRPMRKSV